MERSISRWLRITSPQRADNTEGSQTHSITALLYRWSLGKTHSEQQLYSEIYPRLHRLARGLMLCEPSHHSWGPTELLHESYLRLGSLRGQSWTDRKHFVVVLARAMRRSLVDRARRRRMAKRGSGQKPLPLTAAADLAPRADAEHLALSDALRDLRKIDPFKAELVDLRFYAGFTIAETAHILGCGHTKVERHWRLAQGWLYRQLAIREAS